MCLEKLKIELPGTCECSVLQSCLTLRPQDCSPPGSSVHAGILDPRTAARQAPLSMQGYGSGLPCPPLEDLPNPGIEPRSPAFQADSFPSEVHELCSFPSEVHELGSLPSEVLSGELGLREEITDLSSSLYLVSLYIGKINKQTDTETLAPQCLPGISETLKILSSFPPSLAQSLIKHLQQEEGVKQYNNPEGEKKRKMLTKSDF